MPKSTVPLSSRIDPDLHAQTHDWATTRAITMTDAVSEALSDWCAKQESRFGKTLAQRRTTRTEVAKEVTADTQGQ